LNREAFVVDEALTGATLHTIVGGKLTTHRALAERVVAKIFGRSEPSPTRTEPLPGGAGPRDVADPLWWRHGSRASLVHGLIARQPGWAQVLCPHRPFLVAEAVAAMRDDGAVTFADLMLRRLVHSMGPCMQLECLLGAHGVPARTAVAGRRRSGGRGGGAAGRGRGAARRGRAGAGGVGVMVPLVLPTSLQWLGRPPLWIDPGCRGHVTAVVLWRLGCGHGSEAVADVARAVVEFAGRPVVGLAVHVPCLPAERDTARVVRALHGLPLAAAIDAEHVLVRQLAVAALPVLVLLDARGVVRFQGLGVPHPRRLADAITVLLDEAEHRGELAATAWAPAPLVAPSGRRGLCAQDDQLWLADANTHRLHALDRQARVVRTIGSGCSGSDDGTASEASFKQPVAMVVHDDVLLVADTGSHTLRAIELPAAGVDVVRHRAAQHRSHRRCLRARSGAVHAGGAVPARRCGGRSRSSRRISCGSSIR
jgi:hypothetical protein